MTARERFVRVLTGREADRVPFMKIFGGTNAVVQRWKEQYPYIDTYIDELLGFEGLYRGWQIAPVNTGLCGMPEDKIIFESITETHIRHGDGSLGVYMHADGHFFSHTAEYPVKTREDWQRVKELWMAPDDLRRFPEGWKHYAEMYRYRDYPLQLTCGGVYGFARKMLGDEALCLMLYDDPELVEDIMSTYIDMCIGIWEKMVRDVDFDLVECWEDMAYNGGPLISKRHFDRFLAPQFRRIRTFADEAGIPIVLVDSDGLIMDLAHWMIDAGVNGMYPFEVQAGNSVPEIRRSLPGMGCIGGLDKNCMSRGRAEVDVELERAREFIRLGRYIPGPDHFVLEDVPFDNYVYFMKGLKRVVLTTPLG